jgi:lipopolysaccharide export system protein LptA
MRYIVLITLFLIGSLFGETVEVTADKFEANEKRQISILSGNVTIKKGRDIIKTDKLVIRFDKKNRPVLYESEGRVDFDIRLDNEHYVGKANHLLYDPNNKLYKMSGDVKIKETINGRELIGESVTIDRSSGKSEILGGKNRPVKFIFEVDE